MYHVPIRDRQMENGNTRFYLIDQVLFDSLYSLITHYQNNTLRSQQFKILLGRPVPPQNPHEVWKIIFFNNMVFCYQNCFDLLWEKNVLGIEKNFWNSRLKVENLQKGIPIWKWRANFWVRQLKFTASAWCRIFWNLTKFELI